MYKILVGIPAPPFCRVETNEDGLIIDREVSEDEDIWCDFEVGYNPNNGVGYYYLSFETMLGFDGQDGCRNWIIKCLSSFTDYMKKHGYDTSKELDMFTVFTEGVDVNTKFYTIEDAYAYMKMMVFGFHGKGLEMKEI